MVNPWAILHVLRGFGPPVIPYRGENWVGRWNLIFHPTPETAMVFWKHFLVPGGTLNYPLRSLFYSWVTYLDYYYSPVLVFRCLTNLVVASSSFIWMPFMCHDVSCICKKFEWMVWGRSCPLLSSMTWSSATQESVIMPILSSLLIYIVTKGLEIVCTSGVISKII